MRNLALLLCPLLVFACGDASSIVAPDAGSSTDAMPADSGTADAGACPAEDRCAEVDATRCEAGGFARCTAIDGCLTWVEESCSGACVEDRCHACSGGSGTFPGQTIDVEGETRHYLLHVPSGYRCEAGAPLWIDFHGTAGDQPEEAYRTAELLELASREGVIVVRPRSRFSEEQSGRVYRWDQNPGDIERNIRFTGELIDELADLYHLDPDRRYASGFSSGANMAAQFLGSGRSEVAGVAMVGGGYWSNPRIGDLSARDVRVYAVTGYRDYLIGTLLPLLTELEDQGLDAERIFFREDDAGHELYGWHFEEIWSWRDRGVRPEDSSLAQRWTIDTTFDGDATLIQLAVNAAGDLLATDHAGAIHRFSGGAWSEVFRAEGPFAGPLTGICVLPSGTGIAVGGGSIALTGDAGATWTSAPPAPELSGPFFGFAYLNDVSCFGSDSFVAAGYWSGVRSDDGGASYRVAELPLGGFDFPAQVAAIEVSRSSSTAIAAGYFYLGRSEDAELFTDAGIPPGLDWVNDVASAPNGRWWVAGEAGAIAHSIDDGVTWILQETPIGDDLYAIDFFDESLGIAVGLHGSALYTEDGGATWQDVSTGLDRFLGDVRWIDPATAVAVGERGAVLHFAR